MVKVTGGWEECLELMEERCGVALNDIYAATMEGSNDGAPAAGTTSRWWGRTHRSLAYHEVDWSVGGGGNSGGGGIALFIGKEGSGLSSDVRCDVVDGVIQSVHVSMGSRV